MASVNRAIILGNLGSDPELKYTASGTPVCTLSIATTDYRNDREGNRQEQTEWHRVIVWSKQAENCAKYLSKGRSVYVEGRIQTRSWDDKNTGQKLYSTEIVAQAVQFIGGAREQGQNQGYNPVQEAPSFAPNPNQSAPASNFGGPETASLDDIPF